MELSHVNGPTYSYVDEKLMVIHDQDAYDLLHSLSQIPESMLFRQLNDGLHMVGVAYTNSVGKFVNFMNIPSLTIHHNDGVYESGELIVSIFCRRNGLSTDKLELVTVVESKVIFENNCVTAVIPKFVNQ